MVVVVVVDDEREVVVEVVEEAMIAEIVVEAVDESAEAVGAEIVVVDAAFHFELQDFLRAPSSKTFEEPVHLGDGLHPIATTTKNRYKILFKIKPEFTFNLLIQLPVGDWRSVGRGAD